MASLPRASSSRPAASASEPAGPAGAPGDDGGAGARASGRRRPPRSARCRAGGASLQARAAGPLRAARRAAVRGERAVAGARARDHRDRSGDDRDAGAAAEPRSSAARPRRRSRRCCVQGLVDDAVLLREAYRRGLEQDAVVERHLVQKMRLLLGEEVAEPAEAALRAYFAAAAERYRNPPTVSLDQVFYADPAARPGRSARAAARGRGFPRPRRPPLHARPPARPLQRRRPRRPVRRRPRAPHLRAAGGRAGRAPSARPRASI